MAGMMKKMAAAGIVAGALVSTAATAGVTNVAYDQPAPAGATLVDFNSNGIAGATNLPTGFSLVGGQLVTGAANGYSPPLGDTTQYLMVNANQSATLKSNNSVGYDSVSLYWGSADTFNTLNVLDTANRIIKTISGLDFAAPGANNSFNDYNNPKYNQYVTYTLDSLTGARIGGLQFLSTGTAFELDNVAFFNSHPTSVPEPATLTLFGAGIGGLIAASRRRRKKAA
ncbi:PEP-CTERM sorting domain-containing protein [Sphingomonas paucimobilis]|uniref:Npun_F0296 family exosortase-dependent surface protein n=1 Tax=Sphingomonas paucimobilis TaxID=13689 RepID=UPI0028D77E1F|nr:PEP-CTERM sorting domain-containing protein [Sphingomonas paucimobilis]